MADDAPASIPAGSMSASGLYESSRIQQLEEYARLTRETGRADNRPSWDEFKKRQELTGASSLEAENRRHKLELEKAREKLLRGKKDSKDKKKKRGKSKSKKSKRSSKSKKSKKSKKKKKYSSSSSEDSYSSDSDRRKKRRRRGDSKDLLAKARLSNFFAASDSEAGSSGDDTPAREAASAPAPSPEAAPAPAVEPST